MIGPNELTAAQASLVAAIVGAVSALAVVLVRDLVIERNKEYRQRKRAVVEQKLTEIYSPLWIAFGGDDGQLGNVIGDKKMRDQISARFHLLSPELQDILSRSLLLGHFEKDEFRATTSQMARLLDMSLSFKQTLRRDLEDLQKEFESI
jgi:hypothetical protein